MGFVLCPACSLPTSCLPCTRPSPLSTVKLLWEHRERLGLASNATLDELQMSEGACLSVHANTPAIVAFDHMAVDHKSSVGIIDDSGKLIGNLSVSSLPFSPIAEGTNATRLFCMQRPFSVDRLPLAPLNAFRTTSMHVHSQASDIRDVPFQHFGLLLQPVWKYVAVLHGIGPSVAYVMGGADVAVCVRG